MAQFVAFQPNVEVNGETILSVVAGMKVVESTAYKILEDNGIAKPKPGQWYPQQAWLNAFKSIAKEVGENTLYQIGKQIPNNAQWPPAVTSIESALGSIDIAYHMNHRIKGEVLFNPETGKMKEGIGHYGFEKINDKEIKMTCNNPYPSDFDKGIIQSAAEKFKPADVLLINVELVNPDKSRKKGGDTCIFKVTW
ncbi:MAG: hypothetical protein KKH98_02365 [Spirochaetes bacterium]|nr:hypothetical protein [Spirochaetota bacterium]